MNRRTIVFGMLLVVSLSGALANPIPRKFIWPVPGEVIRPSSAAAIALIVEAYVLAGLLAWKGFRFPRVFFAWLSITLVTYWYMTGLLSLIKLEDSALTFWLIAFLLEIIVVYIEAWIIMRMSESPFFRDPKGSPFMGRTALLISLCGNFVSLLIGFIGFIN
jgi:hypothetical protein